MSTAFDYNHGCFPAIRVAYAMGKGFNKNICFWVEGGLGDRACAEPTLRFIMGRWPELRYSLMCSTPGIFAHLGFKEIFTRPEEFPPDKYLQVPTYGSSKGNNVAIQFLNANLMHGVDFASISAMRGTIPDPELRVPYVSCNISPEEETMVVEYIKDDNYVLCHVGDSWPSRTPPMEWWGSALARISYHGKVPVLVGQCQRKLYYPPNKIIDLRNKTSLEQFIYLCKYSKRILTNDSSPVHLAASGLARIAFLATVRHPAFLTHYRFNGDSIARLGWATRGFFRRRMWVEMQGPVHSNAETDATIVPGDIMDFLPEPTTPVDWLVSL